MLRNLRPTLTSSSSRAGKPQSILYAKLPSTRRGPTPTRCSPPRQHLWCARTAAEIRRRSVEASARETRLAIVAMAGSGAPRPTGGELLKTAPRSRSPQSPKGGRAAATTCSAAMSRCRQHAPEALGPIKSGAVRALGVTSRSARHSSRCADHAEDGKPDRTGVWWGLLAQVDAVRCHRKSAQAAA